MPAGTSTKVPTSTCKSRSLVLTAAWAPASSSSPARCPDHDRRGAVLLAKPGAWSVALALLTHGGRFEALRLSGPD